MSSGAPGSPLLRAAISPETISPSQESHSVPSLSPEVLAQLNQWVTSPGLPTRIMWLCGLPDSTAIQTIVDLCRSHDCLAAVYSFSSKKGSEQMQQLFANLARQLASSIPLASDAIVHALSTDAALASKPLDVQFHTLILDPLQPILPRNRHLPIIIIHGLELYHDEYAQADLLSMIELATIGVKPPVRFLFANYRGPSTDHGQRLRPTTCTYINISSSRGHQNEEPVDVLSNRQRASAPPHGFPHMLTLHHSTGGAESYSRSLMMLGHGIPVWHPYGDLGKPAKYQQSGVSIGDVLSIDEAGMVTFYFNIFLEHGDPAHELLIYENFRPIRPGLDPSEIVIQENYFKPGTVIVSDGVAVSKAETSPLTITATSNKPEGAVIILPDGATRHDLVSTKRFHEYIRKNAAYWYESLTKVNGSLFLVTGCDKASDWANATFPSVPTAPGDHRHQQIRMEYTWYPNYESNWTYLSTFKSNCYAPSIMNGEDNIGRQNQCIFIRGTRISLGDAPWAIASENFWPDIKYAYTNILHNPPSTYSLQNILTTLGLGMTEKEALKRVPKRLAQQLFHPNVLLGQILLEKYPQAVVGLVDDAIWCNITRHGRGTLEEITDLVKRILESHEIVEADGIVTFSKRSKTSKRTPANSSFFGLNRDAAKQFKLIPITEYAKQFRARDTSF